MNKLTTITYNKLESEGTDTDSIFQGKKWFNSCSRTFILVFLMTGLVQASMANEIHLFSDTSGSVVGTLVSKTKNPVLIHGFIEGNILEALEINANSDGTGGSASIDANSDGTGGSASTDANSDGTGGSASTDANSDGTGGSASTYANSDGTGESIISVLLSCAINSTSMAFIENSSETETVIIEKVYLDGSAYSCE